MIELSAISPGLTLMFETCPSCWNQTCANAKQATIQFKILLLFQSLKISFQLQFEEQMYKDVDFHTSNNQIKLTHSSRYRIYQIYVVMYLLTSLLIYF